jgi:thiamine-monophosphate kinase
MSKGAKSLMTRQMGEFEIIERYFAGFITTTGRQIRLGPGDDCGVFAVPPGHEVCISTDTLGAGVHFPLDAPPASIAQRSLVANLSDLAAMGAAPLTCTLALTLDEQARQDAWLAPFSSRLQQLVADYEIPLIGGNLCAGPLSLTFTVLGTVPAGTALLRQDALPGDDVYVTGQLGDAAAGLQLWQAGERAAGQLLQRFLYPVPRLKTAAALRGIANGMIDVSDGLLADIGHICDQSGVGITLDIEALPLSAALLAFKSLEQARLLALGGGDDYEVCFTAAVGQRDQIATVARATSTTITRIGRVIEGAGVSVLDVNGEPVVPVSGGYQHF